MFLSSLLPYELLYVVMNGLKVTMTDSMCLKNRVVWCLCFGNAWNNFFWLCTFSEKLGRCCISFKQISYMGNKWGMMCSSVASMFLGMAEDAVKSLHLVFTVLTKKVLILLPLLEPPCFLKRLSDIVFPITSRLRLECTFTGAPTLFVTWYKDGKQLYASYRYNTRVTESSCALECLHECNSETPGKYSCEVSNSYGTDICHASVTTMTGLYNFGFFLLSTASFSIMIYYHHV